MEQKKHPISESNVLGFLTVAMEFCTLVERVTALSLFAFVDGSIKVLPLLYSKATLLPSLETEDDDSAPEQTVTEEMYETARSGIAALLGEFDSFLETFHPDMPYSDTPIAAFISESLADVYQDIGNFIGLFSHDNNKVATEAVAVCKTNFREYWGQRLLNALKALHAIRYNEENDLETYDIE
ncbi:MAG: DUF5063 domain-containing protein [Tannerellaceae bacterium]|jgi:hypothetical protein|nr:DUF5063 domain-containing protein [Tannerellaceae bacterium]